MPTTQKSAHGHIQESHIESLAMRSRNEIETDIRVLEQNLTDYERRLKPLAESIEELPEESRNTLNSLSARLADEEISDEEFEIIVPREARQLGTRLRAAMQVFRVFDKQKTTLEIELTPYRREDYHNMVLELSERIDFDAVFEYFGEASKTEHSRKKSDSLYNTARELFELRRYRYQITHHLPDDEGNEDFQYYDLRCRKLSTYAGRWVESGFITQNPIRQIDFNGEVNRDIHTHKEVLKYVSQVLSQLETYNSMREVYKHTRQPYTYPYDIALARIQGILDTESEYDEYERAESEFKDIGEIGFEPEFIYAAQRYISRAVAEHRKLGHIAPTEKTLAQERARIEAIDLEEAFGKVKFEGFEAPEGSLAVVTPEEVLLELKDLLPPDFIEGIKSIKYKLYPEKDPEDDSTSKIQGNYIPVFEKNKYTAADIEIYEKLFVKKSESTTERAWARAEFKGTVWHELGHSAHHMMRFDEMETWEYVLGEDDTAVTWYVQYARKKSGNRGKKEDFAETFKLFINRPALLKTLSPARYQFMYEFFSKRLKAEQQKKLIEHIDFKIYSTNMAWDARGYTAEDIRRRYLPSEAAEEE